MTTYVAEKTKKGSTSYKNTDYDLISNNCLQQSFEGSKKGTLNNGKNAGDFFGELESPVPNMANTLFTLYFGNSSFTKKGAQSEIKESLVSNAPPWWYHPDHTQQHYEKWLEYASILGLY